MMDNSLMLIKSYIFEKNLTQKEFCELCKITEVEFLTIMNDFESAKIGTVLRVLNAIDISPSVFFKTTKELEHDELNKKFKL